jgi:hypothetical protein
MHGKNIENDRDYRSSNHEIINRQTNMMKGPIQMLKALHGNEDGKYPEQGRQDEAEALDQAVRVSTTQ